MTFVTWREHSWGFKWTKFSLPREWGVDQWLRRHLGPTHPLHGPHVQSHISVRSQVTQQRLRSPPTHAGSSSPCFLEEGTSTSLWVRRMCPLVPSGLFWCHVVVPEVLSSLPGLTSPAPAGLPHEQHTPGLCPSGPHAGRDRERESHLSLWFSLCLVTPRIL